MEIKLRVISIRVHLEAMSLRLSYGNDILGEENEQQWSKDTPHTMEHQLDRTPMIGYSDRKLGHAVQFSVG